MTSSIRWSSRLVAVLLLLAAALVVLGVSIESATGHSETAETSEHGEGAEAHNESGESQPEADASPGLEGATLAGIPLESPLFIGGLAAASAVLAVAIWVRPGRLTGTLTILFSIAAGAFDASEIRHQAGEGSAGLLAIAVIVVLLRVAAIVGSVIVIRGRAGQLR